MILEPKQAVPTAQRPLNGAIMAAGTVGGASLGQVIADGLGVAGGPFALIGGLLIPMILSTIGAASRDVLEHRKDGEVWPWWWTLLVGIGARVG